MNLDRWTELKVHFLLFWGFFILVLVLPSLPQGYRWVSLSVGILAVPLGLFLFERFWSAKNSPAKTSKDLKDSPAPELYTNSLSGELSRDPLKVNTVAFDSVNSWLGFQFDIKKMKQSPNGKIIFATTFRPLLMGAMTLGAAVFLSLWSVSLRFIEKTMPIEPYWAHILFYVAMAWTAFYGLRVSWYALKPAWFDFSEGVFCKGGNKTQLIYVKEVQLVRVLMTAQGFSQPRNKAYHLYQINIALQDGRRQNVACYVSENNATKDAQELAEALCVPLWNGFVRAK